MKRLLLLFLSLFMTMYVTGQHAQQDLFDKSLYINKKDTLPYRLLKPVNSAAQQLYPLVIFLHGAGERGNDNEAQIKHIKDLFLDSKNRVKFPCFVLAPQCAKDQWWAKHNTDGSMRKSPTLSMKLVIELVDKIGSEFPIDLSRVYITGVSMGGYGAWDLLARFPYKFAAGVPVCGGGDERTVVNIKHIPVWAFHGAKDTLVPPSRSRSMIKALQNAGGSPVYTEYPDIAHNSWVPAYREPNLLPWLFKQKLPSTNN